MRKFYIDNKREKFEISGKVSDSDLYKSDLT